MRLFLAVMNNKSGVDMFDRTVGLPLLYSFRIVFP